MELLISKNMCSINAQREKISSLLQSMSHRIPKLTPPAASWFCWPEHSRVLRIFSRSTTALPRVFFARIFRHLKQYCRIFVNKIMDWITLLNDYDSPEPININWSLEFRRKSIVTKHPTSVTKTWTSSFNELTLGKEHSMLDWLQHSHEYLEGQQVGLKQDQQICARICDNGTWKVLVNKASETHSRKHIRQFYQCFRSWSGWWCQCLRHQRPNWENDCIWHYVERK